VPSPAPASLPPNPENVSNSLVTTLHWRPAGLLAGFSATRPEPSVPELRHVGEHFAPSNWEIGRHRHGGWEIYLQVGGSSEWRQGRRVHRVDGNGACAVAPGVMHELARRPNADHHYAFAIVDVDAVCSRMPELSPAWSTEEPFRVFPGDRLVAPFRRVLEEASVRASFRNRALRLAVEQLVVVATRELTGASWEKVLSAPRVVEEARRLMDARPAEPWKLASLARAVGVSQSHLGALFTKSVGIAPHRYLLERRIALAKEWLLETDRPITSIALDVGFASSQHFAKAFRNATGVSARLFRRGVRS